MHAAERQARRRRQGVLLRDPDVEEAVRVPVAERGETGGSRHGRRDRHDVRAVGGEGDEFAREDRRPVGCGDGDGAAGQRVDDARGVHLVGDVVLGVRVAHAFARDGVDDDRSAVGLRAAQCRLHGRLIVPVDRAEVLDPEVGEHHLRADGVLQPGFHAVQHGVRGRADHRDVPDDAATRVERAFVSRLQTQGGQMIGETADGRRVGPAVVVDDDDQGAILSGRDVVEGLPAHAAGEGAVADDRDDVPVRPAGESEGLGESVRVRQGRRGVGRLHPVVLALGARRVAGQPTVLAQGVEAVGPAGDDLVDVGLVAGVEDHGVGRRLEHAVHGEGQFDHAQVGAEMPTGGGDLLDQELADLRGQLGRLVEGEGTQIGGLVHT